MTTIFNDHENDHANNDILGYSMIERICMNIGRMIVYNRLEGRLCYKGATTSLSAISLVGYIVDSSVHVLLADGLTT